MVRGCDGGAGPEDVDGSHHWIASPGIGQHPINTGAKKGTWRGICGMVCIDRRAEKRVRNGPQHDVEVAVQWCGRPVEHLILGRLVDAIRVPQLGANRHGGDAWGMQQGLDPVQDPVDLGA